MNKLKDVLINYINYTNEKNFNFFEDSFISKYKSFKDVGFALMNAGTILEELTNDNIYILSVKVFLNRATIVIEVNDDKINLIAYAKEGLIKQNSAQKAVNKIKKEIQCN